jgi:hypothetical protein
MVTSIAKGYAAINKCQVKNIIVFSMLKSYSVLKIQKNNELHGFLYLGAATPIRSIYPDLSA